ncbi:DUF1127 domain-containing protein [Yoonia litorea]|uniref:DUF1127 domain-containing protein n=1 Tax=Yoonia litorea TaxID=1123755 RepID=A0A1I6N190_9RHOB|nr:DUF1127 domain-containing protein [Yoonia litorea]SFS21732.1 hypothetical protein SAMN05444714_2930 [Yoonia litorea]
MSLRPDNTLITNREMLTELVLAPFYALARGIERLAESNARTQALRAVSDMTDAELKAKGLTRAEAAAMVFHHDA